MSKIHGELGKQKMADLSPDRVTPGMPPFSFVGVDYFGPFTVKRGRCSVKRYGVLFTCLVLRTIHIEVSHTLAASHHGGVWERCIRSVRKILNSVVRQQTLDDESLTTFMCEVENIINSRPLTAVSNDVKDL